MPRSFLVCRLTQYGCGLGATGTGSSSESRRPRPQSPRDKDGDTRCCRQSPIPDDGGPEVMAIADSIDTSSLGSRSPEVECRPIALAESLAVSAGSTSGSGDFRWTFDCDDETPTGKRNLRMALFGTDGVVLRPTLTTDEFRLRSLGGDTNSDLTCGSADIDDTSSNSPTILDLSPRTGCVPPRGIASTSCLSPYSIGWYGPNSTTAFDRSRSPPQPSYRPRRLDLLSDYIGSGSGGGRDSTGCGSPSSLSSSSSYSIAGSAEPAVAAPSSAYSDVSSDDSGWSSIAMITSSSTPPVAVSGQHQDAAAASLLSSSRRAVGLAGHHQLADGRYRRRRTASAVVRRNKDDGVADARCGGGDSVVRFACDECDRRYATSSNLSRHKQTHRSVDGEHARPCPHCRKLYVSMPALSMHLLTHDLKYRCSVCDKSFSRPWLLRGHERSHTGERPFACSQCGKAFADRSNLRAHVQTHTAAKQFSCPRCAKTFALKSYLTKHCELACGQEQ